ncbi:MAG: pyridoxal-dependent decarboxylase [Gemmatimonadales bacterium]|nr:pyridoxal-dependent decarboxylase [Gemmatimonadales bacterium]
MTHSDPRLPVAEALRAWFLGPRGENADLAERLLLEAFRDHVFWRRNHHPEDGFTIRESDRRRPGYDDAVARLTEELQGLLAALKRDVPFFSGRYQGHMIGEQTLASQIGYLAGMLYNPNNVVTEASPVTTRLELEAAEQLARMIGYHPATSWGHLTSGGTVANFEALWIARGVRYLPVGMALAARDLAVTVEAALPGGATADLRELPLWELLNLTPTAALDAWDAFHRTVPVAVANAALEARTLSSLGYQDYTRQLAAVWTDPLPAGVVLVSSTAHYSWEKIVRALGIGARCLVEVAVDAHARMDVGALEEALARCARERIPVLAVVSVCGTTEEGAIDRLDRIADARASAEREHGITCHLHADACHGGYAASLTRDADGNRLAPGAIRQITGGDWPDDEWVAAISALERADSVTIDPHKYGYVPYPAGAILLRDRRGRNLVSHDPPYLDPGAASGDRDGGGEGFLGRWILEGSKPGAAAAAVWLSHRVIPLDVTGHGHLIAETAAGARALHHALGEPGALGAFRAVRLPEPDLNLVTWVVTHPDCTSLRAVNALNEGIYRRMRPDAEREPDYMLTRTRLHAPGCDGIAAPLLAELEVPGIDWPEQGLVVLRSTVMDPFFAAGPPTPDHLGGLVRAVARAAAETLEKDCSG